MNGRKIYKIFEIYNKMLLKFMQRLNCPKVVLFMKILVTGFNPFGEEKVNPAFEVIKNLKNNIAGADVVKLEVPTVFENLLKPLLSCN